MARSAQSEMRDEVEMVVDADAHVTERIEEYVPYMDEGVRTLFERTDAYFRNVMSLTNAVPPGGEMIGGGMFPTQTIDDKLESMAEYGIDYGVVNATPSLGLNTVNNNQMAVAMANAYNSWVEENFLDDLDHLKACMLVAAHEPDKAAEEIDRRADEDGFVGVQLPPVGLMPPLGHRLYDPIYEAAQRHGLPIMLHGLTSGMQYDFPNQYQWSQTYAENQLLSHPWRLMWHLTTSMYWGLPERFPDLKLVFQEAGVAWIPYMKWRLDDLYLTYANQIPHLEQLPSEYMNGRYYFTTQPIGHTAQNPTQIAKAMELAGPDLLMFSSDLPHPAFDPPAEVYDRIRSHLDDEDVQKIMGRNAADVFGFD